MKEDTISHEKGIESIPPKTGHLVTEPKCSVWKLNMSSIQTSTVEVLSHFGMTGALTTVEFRNPNIRNPNSAEIRTNLVRISVTRAWALSFGFRTC